MADYQLDRRLKLQCYEIWYTQGMFTHLLGFQDNPKVNWLPASTRVYTPLVHPE